MVALTRPGLLFGYPTAPGPEIGPKTAAGLPAFGTSIPDFDTWRPGYGEMSVLVIRANTTEHAPLFADPQLTISLPNPQVLLNFEDANGDNWGKWAQPVYTYVPYQMTINETNLTSIIRPPLVDLAGQDVSKTVIAAQRATYLRTLEAVVDQQVFAEAFGSLAEVNGAEANTAVLQAAIGAAAAQGAGRVILPAGRIVFTAVTLPGGVVLAGQGLGATFLTSTFGGPAVRLGGDGAGLADLTLDGINLASGSIGVYGVGVVAAVFENVTVKRFAQGVVMRGISASSWRQLYVSNCTIGLDLRGDTDPSGNSLGGEVRTISWHGGGVSLCTTAGLKFTFFDALTENIWLQGLEFIDNLGDTILLNGVRNFSIEGPSTIRSAEGQTAFRVRDDSNLALRTLNTTDHVTIRNTIIESGALVFDGTCASVSLYKCDLRGVSLDMSVPLETIVLQDCIEDAATTITGDATKLMRAFMTDDLTIVGNTTDAVPLAAWPLSLEPGQLAYVSAEVVAQQQNGAKWGIFHVAVGAARPGSTLNFNLQTDNFVAGAVVEGALSTATARIIAVTQSAGSGTLTLGDIEGTFLNGEVITDTEGGFARVDGTISGSNAALDGGGSTDLRAQQVGGSAAYDAYWDVSGAKVRLMLVGDTNELVQWTARVRRLDS